MFTYDKNHRQQLNRFSIAKLFLKFPTVTNYRIFLFGFRWRLLCSNSDPVVKIVIVLCRLNRLMRAFVHTSVLSALSVWIRFYKMFVLIVGADLYPDPSDLLQTGRVTIFLVKIPPVPALSTDRLTYSLTQNLHQPYYIFRQQKDNPVVIFNYHQDSSLLTLNIRYLFNWNYSLLLKYVNP